MLIPFESTSIEILLSLCIPKKRFVRPVFSFFALLCANLAVVVSIECGKEHAENELATVQPLKKAVIRCDVTKRKGRRLEIKKSYF